MTYVYSGLISLVVALISHFLFNTVSSLYNVHKFREMYFRVYINPLLKRVNSFQPDEGKNDITTAKIAEDYLKKIKYSLENELNRLNTSYSFKIVRIAEFTINELGNVIKISKEYKFTSIGAGGQNPEFLKRQQKRMLSILENWKEDVKKYYKLKID